MVWKKKYWGGGNDVEMASGQSKYGAEGGDNFRKRSRGPVEQLLEEGTTFETGNSRRRFERTSSLQW